MKVKGLGTDGGSNLCGKRNSVYTLLKAIASDLKMVRCVCHALDNAALHASKELPSTVEYMLHEVYNWFSSSTLRQSEYKNFGIC